jgi:hypothetical protein
MKSGLEGWQFGSSLSDDRHNRVVLRRTCWWRWEKQDRKEFQLNQIYNAPNPFGVLFVLLIISMPALLMSVWSWLGISLSFYHAVAQAGICLVAYFIFSIQL